jgi:membrane peptidoglycan carboxypeptidase
VPPGQLSWAQASLLAGLVQAPSKYDPHGHLSLARKRQSHVLARLVATHQLTAAEAAAAWNAPLNPAVAFHG